MRGRKNTPTPLKLVKGNPGKRPLPENEPRIPPAEPTPPAFLNDDAKVEWGRVVSMLYNVGLMTDADRAALAAYCQAYGVWAIAERELTKLVQAKGSELAGLILGTKSGNVIQQPLLGIANKARADVVRYAAEFGMTPAARARVQANPDANGEEALGVQKYFA